MASACIFGSTARKRADMLSDKDLLIVAESDAEIMDAAQEWPSGEWSISKFTHRQMLDMAGKGSLFLQHLKQEGIIVRDDDGFLGSVISRFTPRFEYFDDARESLTWLRGLTSVQVSYWPMLCAADIAYGAIRNIAILQLASKGTYVFDYSDLIERFASEVNLPAGTRRALLDLRILKHGYRGRLVTLTPQLTLFNALTAAQQIFARRGCGTASNRLDNGYRGLRMFELYLVSRADPRELDLLPQDDPLASTWALIRNPCGYRPRPRLADEKWLEEQYWLARKRFRDDLMSGKKLTQ